VGSAKPAGAYDSDTCDVKPYNECRLAPGKGCVNRIVAARETREGPACGLSHEVISDGLERCQPTIILVKI
jgi:hypothetical protein